MAWDTWRGIRQPLKRGWITLSPYLAPYDIGGYAYVNPLAGLKPHARVASYHIMAGYAYVNLRASESRARRSFSSAERR